MSQLNAVLRRSIAHLDPSDRMGRERVFASARQAMIRLLGSYEPTLSDEAIDRKIEEFDDFVGTIESEFVPQLTDARRPAPRFAPVSAIGSPTPSASRMLLAAPAASHAVAELDPPEEDEACQEQPWDGEPSWGNDREDGADEDGEYQEYDPPEYADDDYDEDRRASFMDRLPLLDRRTIALAASALIAVCLLAVGGYVYSRSASVRSTHAQTAAVTAPAENAGPATTSEPAVRQAEPTAPQPDASPAVQAAASTPAAPIPTGALALETIVLFDGRDPSVFQSAPDNPVFFQGDTGGGFARVSSSTGSTGSRLMVGRGVYDHIQGHTIRIVLVARATKDKPADGFRFAYQNGRNISPWQDGRLTAAYAPYSLQWTVPKRRGGPDNDTLVIEPGIPGDRTAVDIRSVRIEILQ